MPWTVELAAEFAGEFSALPEIVQDELLAHWPHPRAPDGRYAEGIEAFKPEEAALRC